MPSLRRVWILRDVLKIPCEPRRKKTSYFPLNPSIQKSWVYCNPHTPPVQIHPHWTPNTQGFTLLRCPNWTGPSNKNDNGTLQDSVDLTTTISSVGDWNHLRSCGYTPPQTNMDSWKLYSGKFEKGGFLFYWINFLGKGWWWISILLNYTLED